MRYLLFLFALAMFTNGVLQTKGPTTPTSTPTPVSILQVSSSADLEFLSRAIYAETTCESAATRVAVGYVIASSARNAGLVPAQAMRLDRGYYLSSYLMAATKKSNNNTSIYFGPWSEFSKRKCADVTIESARIALTIVGNTPVYHFDTCGVPVNWKNPLVEFRVADGDPTCFYARNQNEANDLKEKVQ